MHVQSYCFTNLNPLLFSPLLLLKLTTFSASQDEGGHAISRQKKSRVVFGLPYLLIEFFFYIYWYACGGDEREG